MNRRHFLMTTAAMLAVTPALAAVDYTPGLVQTELAAGKTVGNGISLSHIGKNKIMTRAG